MTRKRSPTDRPSPDGEAGEQTPGAAKAPGQAEASVPSAVAGGADATGGMPDGKPTPSQAAASAEPLRAELEEALGRAGESLSRLQQVAADYENYRKWAERERAEAVLKERSALMCEVIDIMENLERAMDAGRKELPAESALMKGLSMTQEGVRRFLEASGVRRIEAVGKRFDPQCHEAVYFISVPGRPEYSVAEELRRGYTMGGRLLRASKVSVVSRPELPAATGACGGDGAETPARKT